MVNSEKGHRGFITKFQALGPTRQIRVPTSIFDKVKEIVFMLEDIARREGLHRVDKVLDKVIEGLQNV